MSGDGNEQASMGVDAADYDNDGRLDLYSTHFASDYSTLYRNLGGLLFEDVTARARIREPEWPLVKWGTRIVDLDQDGWKDIVHANGHVYPHLRNAARQGDLRAAGAHDLPEQPATGPSATSSSEAGPDATKRVLGRGTAFADLDNDGDLDVVVACLDSQAARAAQRRRARATGSCSGRSAARATATASAPASRCAPGPLSQVWEVKRTARDLLRERPAGALRPGRGDEGRPRARRVAEREGGRVPDVPADRHYRVDEAEGLSPEPLRGR